MVKDKLRMNLKELRDALIKLPEKFLEDSSIALDSCISDNPTNDFNILTSFGNHFQDEGDLIGYTEEVLGKIEEYDTIQERLIEFLNKDLKQAKTREGEKDFDEEYNIEGDW